MIRRPRVSARLERRILVNYRVDPKVAAAVIPAPFRPLIVAGYAVAGICLSRLSAFRPAGLPAVAWGPAENAAHRFAVRWDTPAGPATGVWIPRRDTSSALVALAGGRAFPGWHHRARFEVAETASRYSVALASADGDITVRVTGDVSDQLPAGSVFADPGAASRFFRRAPAGYSPRRGLTGFEGVELACRGWNLSPLAVRELSSSYFGDDGRFPPGSIELDSGFLMRDLDTTWSATPPLRPDPADSPSSRGVTSAYC